MFLSQGVDYLGFLNAKLRDLEGWSTLANELIQNAVEHGFKQTPSGEIHVNVEEKDGDLKGSILWGGGSVLPVTSTKVEGDSLIITRINESRSKDAEGKTKEESFPVTVEDYVTAKALAESYVLQVMKLQDFELRLVGA